MYTYANKVIHGSARAWNELNVLTCKTKKGKNRNGPGHENWYLSHTSAHSHFLNVNDHFSNETRLLFGLSLPLFSFIVIASGEGSSEDAHMRSLARAIAVRLCDKYPNFTVWLK